MNRIKVHDRIAAFQRSLAPGFAFVVHFIADDRNQLGRDLDAMQFPQHALHGSEGHAVREQVDDLVVEIGQPTGVLFNALRFERAASIPRYVERYRARGR